MSELRYLLHFFRVVPPVSSMMTMTFVVMTTLAAGVIVGHPDRAAGALTPVLLLQLFATSSGFFVPARRGHYDLLLTRGGSRTLVALTHWATSAAPGVASWLVLAIVELVATAGTRATLLASGTCLAVALLSTLPWALTVSLPRFSGGIGWLLVLVTTASTSTRPVIDWRGESMLAGSWWPAWSLLIYPVAVVGQRLDTPQLAAAAPAFALAACAMASACRWIARADVPLEAAQ